MRSKDGYGTHSYSLKQTEITTLVFLIVLTSTEKRRILKRRWTRKGKRKSMRPNPKTRT